MKHAKQPSDTPQTKLPDLHRMIVEPASIRIGGEVFRNGKWVDDPDYEDMVKAICGWEKEEDNA